VRSPEVGAFLREQLYHGGRTQDWRATLVRATGRPLDSGAFVADLAAGVAPPGA
jgi:hypothetical protein